MTISRETIAADREAAAFELALTRSAPIEEAYRFARWARDQAGGAAHAWDLWLDLEELAR